MKILDTLRAVKIRESSAWKAMDWALSEANKDANVKIKAAEFVLKRIYPEKTIHEGSDENPIRVVYRAAADIPKPKAG
jgi:hypothetical protein